MPFGRPVGRIAAPLLTAFAPPEGDSMPFGPPGRH